MKITIRNSLLEDAGVDAVHVDGDGEVILDGSVIRNSGRHNIAMFSKAPLMQQLGLPSETDPGELAELLELLRQTQESERDSVLKSTTLFQRWIGLGANAISLGANLVTIAGADNVKQLIQNLLKN